MSNSVALNRNLYQQIDWDPATLNNYYQPSPWQSNAHFMPRYGHVNSMPMNLFQEPTAQELLDETKWKLNEELAQKTELQTVAGDLLQSVSDPKLNATDFMKFVEKLSTGENTLENPNVDAEKWAQEYATSSFRNQASRNGDSSLNSNLESQEYWKKLETEWERLTAEVDAAHPWLQEPQSLSSKVI